MRHTKSIITGFEKFHQTKTHTIKKIFKAKKFPYWNQEFVHEIAVIRKLCVVEYEHFSWTGVLLEAPRNVHPMWPRLWTVVDLGQQNRNLKIVYGMNPLRSSSIICKELWETHLNKYEKRRNKTVEVICLLTFEESLRKRAL